MEYDKRPEGFDIAGDATDPVYLRSMEKSMELAPTTAPPGTPTIDNNSGIRDYKQRLRDYKQRSESLMREKHGATASAVIARTRKLLGYLDKDGKTEALFETQDIRMLVCLAELGLLSVSSPVPSQQTKELNG